MRMVERGRGGEVWEKKRIRWENFSKRSPVFLISVFTDARIDLFGELT